MLAREALSLIQAPLTWQRRAGKRRSYRRRISYGSTIAPSPGRRQAFVYAATAFANVRDLKTALSYAEKSG